METVTVSVIVYRDVRVWPRMEPIRTNLKLLRSVGETKCTEKIKIPDLSHLVPI